jgi:AbrB-like transcriptional regulator
VPTGNGDFPLMSTSLGISRIEVPIGIFSHILSLGSMSKKKSVEPLTGEELLQRVKDLGNLSKEEKARQCGYFTETKKGVERVNLMKFYNALIDAEGIELDGKQSATGRGGRLPSNKVTVQSNGNMLIGAAYTKRMGLKEGDAFEITLGRKHIRLKQIEE